MRTLKKKKQRVKGYSLEFKVGLNIRLPAKDCTLKQNASSPHRRKLQSGIVRGLNHRLPNLDLVSVRDVRLASTPDPIILDWAAQALPLKSERRSSLCSLCVLCVSVVDEFLAKHTTETQRTQRLHREISEPGLLRQSRYLGYLGCTHFTFIHSFVRHKRLSCSPEDS